MNKQSVIVTKWFNKKDKERLYYYSYTQLLFHEDIAQLESVISTAPKGTKWKLTLEEVEE